MNIKGTTIDNEDDLFRYIKTCYIPDLEKSTDQFCGYDCFSKSFKCLIELKCRRKHYDKLMIEKYKYDTLLKYKCKSFYINSTPSGVYLFNIHKIKPEWTKEKKMPHKTDFHIFRKEVDKEYGLLKISEAKKL
jgi:hypothetical protein